MYRVCVFLLTASLLSAGEKLTDEQRIELLRGLTAEYATVKTYLPRSKKALEVKSNGTFSKGDWMELGKQVGPAARIGDLVQITSVKIDDDRIILEINGGGKSGKKWYQNVEVGVGGRTRPVGNQNTSAPGGTTLALVFDGNIPALPAADIKKMLAPVLDFDRQTAAEQTIDMLPPEIKQAVTEKRAIEGMDRDQVILALGRPRTKVRETKEGLDEEDWIYGNPPGKVTFVTFANGKVVRVKDAYAGLGGQTAPPLKPQI